MIYRYKIQQDKGQYCLKGCDDGDLMDYASHEAAVFKLNARIRELEKEQWLVAECIFQNVSAAEMKHWAQGIKVSLSGADKVPRFTVETEPKHE